MKLYKTVMRLRFWPADWWDRRFRFKGEPRPTQLPAGTRVRIEDDEDDSRRTVTLVCVGGNYEGWTRSYTTLVFVAELSPLELLAEAAE